MASTELNALVLQGGGALGAYQAGAFAALDEAGFSFDWIAGISIGAINAALICGNRKEDRVAALETFWNRITANLAVPAPFWMPAGRRAFSELAAAEVTMAGAPGFFKPRLPTAIWPFGPAPALSIYDTAPLEATLTELVDFDLLNEAGPRLCVGATDVETGNFTYFDSRSMRIDARHIMASGALPPGFPPVEIDGHFYWDGGLVSNTPLQYVMEEADGDDPLCVFQVDLFNAHGGLPIDVLEVQQRQKDIQYSSRTRLTTDRYRELHALQVAAERLAKKLPQTLKDDPDLAKLRHAGPSCPVTLVHLIHRKEGFEGSGKDYEFSRQSMSDHWAAGRGDVTRTLAHTSWKSRRVGADGLTSEVDLKSLIAELADTFALIAADEGQSLSFSTDEGSDYRILGDDQMLQQMVVNLLQNAITHGSNGNDIEVKLTRQAEHVQFRVADRGPGIPEDSKERVFEPFHRLDPSRSKPGSGLGLALVRAIAEKHNGHVALHDNHPGLIVEVTFPSCRGKCGSPPTRRA